MRFITLWTIVFLCSPVFGDETSNNNDPESSVTVQVDLSTKGNNIEFDQKAIEVPFGKTVFLVFKNQANPDSQIDHNIIILKPGSEDRFIKDMQKVSYNLEKLKLDKDIVAFSKRISPGEETTVSFTPEKPGFYPYMCTMPGHGDILGMRGIMHVK